jgi:uncharacterized protein HemY
MDGLFALVRVIVGLMVIVRLVRWVIRRLRGEADPEAKTYEDAVYGYRRRSRMAENEPARDSTVTG